MRIGAVLLDPYVSRERLAFKWILNDTEFTCFGTLRIILDLTKDEKTYLRNQYEYDGKGNFVVDELNMRWLTHFSPRAQVRINAEQAKLKFDTVVLDVAVAKVKEHLDQLLEGC